MKKLVFGISNLNIGGAEKVLVDLVNRLKDDYDITIFTIYGNGQLESTLDRKIKVKSFIKKSRNELSFLHQKIIGFIFNSYFLRKLVYKKYIKNKYDRKIAFLEGPITAMFSSEKNNIAWVHTDLSKHLKGYKKQEKIYNKYNKIIFVSHDSLLNFNKVIDVNVKKEVIYNYIDIESIINKSKETSDIDVSDGFLVLARLVPAKGIDRLIDVSLMLKKDNIDHKIYIIGDGELRLELEEKINKLDLNKNVVLLGFKNNPYPYIKNCKYFLLPSLYEGFGMTIIEAMILGKNIIITETGAKEALQGYNSKLIVKNSVNGLYEGLKNILNSEYTFNITETYSYQKDEILNKLKKLF
jgi:glycosyltransferase involved in cell wall biosynthesis